MARLFILSEADRQILLGIRHDIKIVFITLSNFSLHQLKDNAEKIAKVLDHIDNPFLTYST